MHALCSHSMMLPWLNMHSTAVLEALRQCWCEQLGQYSAILPRMSYNRHRCQWVPYPDTYLAASWLQSGWFDEISGNKCQSFRLRNFSISLVNSMERTTWQQVPKPQVQV